MSFIGFSPSVLNSEFKDVVYKNNLLTPTRAEFGTIFIWSPDFKWIINDVAFLPCLLTRERVVINGCKSSPSQEGLFVLDSKLFTNVEFDGKWVIYS